MEAANVVRFRVKPGFEKEFVDLHNSLTLDGMNGIESLFIVKTGEREYCLVGEWDSMDALAAARPAMIGNLDKMRNMLEDLGNGLGVTDPVSGDIILRKKAPQAQRQTA
jgi:hypothetical protein